MINGKVSKISLKLSRSAMKIFFILPLLFLQAACNSLFYFPADKKIYNKNIPEKHTDGFIDSASGNRLHYFYFESERPRALILFFHGNARNITSSFKNFLWAVPKGFDLLVWDYSGYGESSGRATRENIYKDSLSTLEFAVKIKNEKRIRLITTGQSLGGAVMLGALGGFEARHEVDIILADCTFWSYKEIAREEIRNFTCLPACAGFSITDDYAPYKVFSQIKDIPIIISHCREDKTVPFRLGEELYEKLESKNKRFIEFSCKHTAAYWREENQKLLLNIFDEILKERVGQRTN
jgi:fermentation-respiration switch protein FrsA (DUF1100 family)